ncbi:MAG: DUF6519 domain-containing protein [Methanothrix sp.]|nr:DUF6519 domain-containing protein [Methanothrix sp.]
MKGDFTRFTYKSKKHYTRVLRQQGRVDLDADWNEQAEIVQNRIEKESKDLIGSSGVPKNVDGTGGGGFKISPKKDAIKPDKITDLGISPGRIYVDGILCELDDDPANPISYYNQPDCPNPRKIKPPTTGNRTDLVYLEVWQRHITTIEDPEIREEALGGPDTTTRVRTVWQVKILEGAEVSDCHSDSNKWNNLIKPSGGQLTVNVVPSKDPKRPCEIGQSGGYIGIENRLYRVEIHEGGKQGGATFKWSRDNGSVAFPISEFDANDYYRFSLKRLGRDQILTLHKGDWVEVLDDVDELSGKPGIMAEVKEDIDDSTLTVILSKDISKYASRKTEYLEKNIDIHPKVRRWDQKSDAIFVTAAAPIDLELEDGIRIQFSGGNFKTGDYWVFAARTTTGKVDDLVKAPPMGIIHHYCRLAMINWSFDPRLKKAIGKTIDCRRVFPPLTGMISMFYVGGDGQEAMPGCELPEELQVGVANGGLPVANAPVKFELEDKGSSGDSIKSDTFTGPDGIARCTWTLGTSKPGRLTATLRDKNNNQLGLPIFFNANLSIASDVSFDPKECPSMSRVKTVQEAITNLCRGEPRIRINRISIGVPGERPLLNDGTVFPDELREGIKILFYLDDSNEKLNMQTPSRAPFFLTIDMPFPINNVDRELWGNKLIGFQQIVLNSSIVPIDNGFIWKPTNITIPWLNRLLDLMRKDEIGDCLLARLILKGNFIWSENPPRRYYLDGEAFGTPDRETSNNLILPSGDGKRGGDFEMWFWIIRKE